MRSRGRARRRAALERAASALESSFTARPAVGASIRDALGEAYLDLGEPTRAIAQFEQALSLMRQSPDPDERETLRVMGRIAEAYLAGGKADRAVSLYLEALTHARTRWGADDRDVLVFMNNLGRAYLALEPVTAGPILRDVLARWMRADHNDWHTYEAATLLGRFLLLCKDYTGAETYLLQGYDGLKAREDSIPTRSRRRIAEAHARIVELYDAWGKPERAEGWRKKAP